MTERQYLTTTDLNSIYLLLQSRNLLTDRKARLYICACFRAHATSKKDWKRDKPGHGEILIRLAELGERAADGWTLEMPEDLTIYRNFFAVRDSAIESLYMTIRHDPFHYSIGKKEMARLLRCIFGNPFKE